MCDLDPTSKLNVVFDIDNTLILTFDKSLYPELKFKNETAKNIHSLKIGDAEVWLIVRYGAREALEYLSTFCNLYVYSHGMLDYINAILNVLDPDHRLFKDRLTNVLAPRN